MGRQGLHVECWHENVLENNQRLKGNITMDLREISSDWEADGTGSGYLDGTLQYQHCWTFKFLPQENYQSSVICGISQVHCWDFNKNDKCNAISSLYTLKKILMKIIGLEWGQYKWSWKIRMQRFECCSIHKFPNLLFFSGWLWTTLYHIESYQLFESCQLSRSKYSPCPNSW